MIILTITKATMQKIIRLVKSFPVDKPKTKLSAELGLSTRTIAKIAKGEKLSKRSIQKIADYGIIILKKDLGKPAGVLCIILGLTYSIFSVMIFGPLIGGISY